jgi:hypothetical protein
MHYQFSLGFTALCLLTLFVPPTLAKDRSRSGRYRAWCEKPHDDRHLNTHCIHYHKVKQATKDCCAAVNHLAWYNEMNAECRSQAGVIDRSIDWYKFRACCKKRKDAGSAGSIDYFFDEMDETEEAMGLKPPQGNRWLETDFSMAPAASHIFSRRLRAIENLRFNATKRK